jgi:hypothetical protein
LGALDPGIEVPLQVLAADADKVLRLFLAVAMAFQLAGALEIIRCCLGSHGVSYGWRFGYGGSVMFSASFPPPILSPNQKVVGSTSHGGVEAN